MAYIDIVAVKLRPERPYLFQAPSWSAIREGDQVKVETSNGTQIGEVVAKDTFDDARDDFDFIVKAMSATLPLKRVLGMIRYTEIDYTDGN